MNTSVSITTISLHSDLAIKEANKAQHHADRAVHHAICCGQALIKLKSELPHGEFEPWVESNMPVGIHQCRTYMRVSVYVLNRESTLVLDGKTIEGIDSLRAADVKRTQIAEKKQVVANQSPAEKQEGKAKEQKLSTAVNNFVEKKAEEQMNFNSIVSRLLEKGHEENDPELTIIAEYLRKHKQEALRLAS